MCARARCQVDPSEGEMSGRPCPAAEALCSQPGMPPVLCTTFIVTPVLLGNGRLAGILDITSDFMGNPIAL